MLPYPPSTKPGAVENSLLRVLGGVLAFLSLLLTLLGIILHQRVSDIILAIIVGMFALRVFLLWLGDKPQHQQHIPKRSSLNPVMYPVQPPPYTAGQHAPYALPYIQSQPLYPPAQEPHRQQSVPMPPAASTPASPALPNSIRPQRPPEASPFPAQPAPPSQAVRPIPPSPSLWLHPPYAPVSMPSPAPLPRPSQQGIWQYDDGKHIIQQQRGNDHGSE